MRRLKSLKIGNWTRCCSRYRDGRRLIQIETFQEQPNLLDSSLQSLIDPLIPYFVENVEEGFSVKAQQCFRIMYHYTKIRGYKITSRVLMSVANSSSFSPK